MWYEFSYHLIEYKPLVWKFVFEYTKIKIANEFIRKYNKALRFINEKSKEDVDNHIDMVIALLGCIRKITQEATADHTNFCLTINANENRRNVPDKTLGVNASETHPKCIGDK